MNAARIVHRAASPAGRCHAKRYGLVNAFIERTGCARSRLPIARPESALTQRQRSIDCLRAIMRERTANHGKVCFPSKARAPSPLAGEGGRRSRPDEGQSRQARRLFAARSRAASAPSMPFDFASAAGRRFARLEAVASRLPSSVTLRVTSSPARGEEAARLRLTQRQRSIDCLDAIMRARTARAPSPLRRKGANLIRRPHRAGRCGRRRWRRRSRGRRARN
jgi:hypothetical protein